MSQKVPTVKVWNYILQQRHGCQIVLNHLIMREGSAPSREVRSILRNHTSTDENCDKILKALHEGGALNIEGDGTKAVTSITFNGVDLFYSYEK